MGSIPSSSVGKQSQLLLKPTEVELGLQVGVEFDKNGGVGGDREKRTSTGTPTDLAKN